MFNILHNYKFYIQCNIPLQRYSANYVVVV